MDVSVEQILAATSSIGKECWHSSPLFQGRWIEQKVMEPARMHSGRDVPQVDTNDTWQTLAAEGVTLDTA